MDKKVHEMCPEWRNTFVVGMNVAANLRQKEPKTMTAAAYE
jgi:hypothetical protein